MGQIPRFVWTPGGVLDRDTGLEWERGPRGRVPWADAAAAARAEGWRLPTATEVVTLLTGLPPDLPGTLAVGDVLWSSSSSPFAPATRVRAVSCERPGRFVVVLVEATELARWWGVRRPSSAVSRPGPSTAPPSDHDPDRGSS